ncbi:uncharacterized protein L199_002652 [Kwoniella botswanensis]|uniref:uncharacterized protein n=1 Tax=Kwoniella botswanensis TaxID=1268659 RepID=UPI00315C5EFE
MRVSPYMLILLLISNESTTHVTHIISCVNDPRSGEEVNRKVEFNIVSASPDLSTAESMHVVVPSQLQIHHRPGSEIVTLKVDRDIRSEAEVNIRPQIECEFTPTPMIMEEDQSRGKLRLDGEQWIPLQLYRPSLASKALNGLNQDSKNLLSSILNDNARNLTLSAISEDTDDRRVIWNFDPNDIGSLRPPEPKVSLWYQGLRPEDEDMEEISVSTARHLFAYYRAQGGKALGDDNNTSRET